MPYMGNQPATSFSSVSYQDLTGSNGTSFTLDFPVGNAQEIEVFVNNVRQEPGVAYTANGTELITTGSISISDDFYVVFSGKAQQSATHPANQDLDANNGTFTGTVTANSFIGIPNPSLIINGGFQVWQRATAATDVGGNDVYNTADRWVFWENTDGAFTTEQSTDVPSGQGFAYSLKAACTTADTLIAAGQFSLIGHKIEAQNLSQLNYGTSSAKTMTLSFWVKSNKTGTYCFSIEKDDETDYILIKEFSISSADTWEKKTLTITPDSNIKASSGAITNDNGIGLRLLWALALGTTYNAGSDDGTWTTSTHFGTTNQVNWMDSTSNTFYITGVKLEVGDTATDFEHESYGTTLHKCRRYCRVYNAGSDYNQVGGTGFAINSTTVNIPILLDPQMRTTPSLTASGGNHQLSDGAAGTVIGGISVITAQSSKDVLSMAPTASGLTQHRPYRLESQNNSTARITISAEL